jgi:hypothetical protein
MPYAERVGQSKLHVARDGIRFFTTIVQAAMCYRPARPVLLVAGGVALAALGVGIQPSLFYLQHGRLEEWMIYRILLASLLSTLVAILLCSAVVADRIAGVAHGRPATASGLTGAVARLFTRRARRIGGLVLLAAAVALMWPGIVEYTTTGHVTTHWSRAVLASLLLVVAVALASTTFLLNMMVLIQDSRSNELRSPEPDRTRVARTPAP